MRALTWVLALGLLLSACTDSGSDSTGEGGSGKGGDEKAGIRGVQRDIDTLMNDAGREMATAVEGQVRNATGRFVVCQSSSDYRYVGAMELVEPLAADGRAVRLGEILADQGFANPDTTDDRVTAQRGQIRATVSERYPAGFRSVKFESDCIDAGDDAAYVEDAPVKDDYPDLG